MGFGELDNKALEKVKKTDLRPITETFDKAKDIFSRIWEGKDEHGKEQESSERTAKDILWDVWNADAMKKQDVNADEFEKIATKIDSVLYNLLAETDKDNFAERYKLDAIKGILKDVSLPNVIKGVSYFCCCRAALFCAFTSDITKYQIISAKNELEEVKAFCADVISVEYVRQNYGSEYETKLPEILEATTGFIGECVESVQYLLAKMITGILSVAEDTVDFTVGSIADLANHPEIAERLYEYKLTDRMTKAIEDSYDGWDFVKEIGGSAEKIGEIGTYLGLSIISTAGLGFPFTIAATTIIGLARAGEAAEKTVDTLGEYNRKALLTGLSVGVATVITNLIVADVNKGIDNLANQVREKIVEKFGGIGGKILEESVGTLGHAVMGGTTTLFYEMQGVLNDLLLQALDIRDDFSVEWKKVVKSVAVGALFSAALFLSGELIKETKAVIQDNDNVKDIKEKQEIADKAAQDSNDSQAETVGNEIVKGLTAEEKEFIKAETGWSDEIIEHIKSMEQYEIYKKADLHEGVVNGRKCLLKNIDLDYVDPKTGMTNRQLMEAGRSPIDSVTGEKIELHHMGQDYNGPFAELCENMEHGGTNHKILHTEDESWRRDPVLKNKYNNVDRPDHWKERVKEA